MTPTVRMWRCTRCGKWSHARRKPSWHQRFVWSPEPGDRVVRQEHDPHPEHGATVYWVACGPFEPWDARRAEA